MPANVTLGLALGAAALFSVPTGTALAGSHLAASTGWQVTAFAVGAVYVAAGAKVTSFGHQAVRDYGSGPTQTANASTRRHGNSQPRGLVLEVLRLISLTTTWFILAATATLAALVDYVFGDDFDSWWVGTGFELWLQSIGHASAAGARAHWNQVVRAYLRIRDTLDPRF